MELEEICSGEHSVVLAAPPAKEYLDGLSPRKEAGLMRTMARFADKGRISNPEKCKNVEDDLFEFKEGQERVFGVHRGREGDKGRMLLTNGFTKKKRKIDRRHIDKAWSTYKRVEEALANKDDDDEEDDD